MGQSCRLLFVSLLLLGGLRPCFATDASPVHPYLSDTFFIDVGIFWPDRRLGLSVDGSAGEVHEPIEFDEDLKLKKADSLFALEFGWRFGERWRMAGQYFESSGTTSWVLEEDVEWQDVVFQADTAARGGSKFEVIRTFFAREFDVGRRHEFGLGAGIHWLDIGASIEGTILVADGRATYAAESVGVSGPLPNIGAWYNYAISSRWALTSRIDFFSAEFGRYSGTMTNLAIGINCQLARHFGLGLNYNYLDLAVDIDKAGWHGRVETSYEGLFANLSFYW